MALFRWPHLHKYFLNYKVQQGRLNRSKHMCEVSSGRDKILFISKLGILICAFILLYYEDLNKIFKMEFFFEIGTKILILGGAVYILWTRKTVIKQTEIRPNILWGALLLVSSCLLFIAGRWSATVILENMSLIVTLFAFALIILGTSQLKNLFVPIFYLIFTFSFFYELLNPVVPLLQKVTATLSGFLLQVVGIPVLMEKEMLYLPNITLEIAKGCSGINHAVALTAIGVVYLYSAPMANYIRAIILSGLLLFSVILNSFRIALIGVVSYTSSANFSHERCDFLYSVIVVLLGMMFYLFLYWKQKTPVGAESATLSSDKRGVIPITRKLRMEQMNIPILVSTVILVVAIITVRQFSPQYIELEKDLSSFPWQIGTFKGEKYDSPEKYIFNADRIFERTYVHNNGMKINVYVGYFGMQRYDKELINHRTAKYFDRAQPLEIMTGGEAIAQKINLINDRQGRNIYSWYFIDGVVVSNKYIAKIRLIKNAFARRETSGTVVIIKGDGGGNVMQRLIEAEFLRHFILTAKEYLR